MNQPEIDLQLLQTEPQTPGLRKMARRVLACLARTRFGSYAQDVMSLWRGGWIDSELAVPEDADVPTVVMTVAHGDACYAAMRYANRHNLPLVTFFHDWWPDIAGVHRIFRRILNRSFLRLYQESSLALCVGPGMKDELGPHANSKVLLPIPAANNSTENRSATASKKNRPFKLLYAGSLADYGPMLIAALENLKDHPTIRLEVRGNSKDWPDAIKNEMRECGLLLPFEPRQQLDDWLNSADAFLVPQSFEQQHSRLMQTNFPSKMLEFAQFGKPLLLWGPNYASGSRWATETGCGLVVDLEEPDYLRQAVERLSGDPDMQERLAAAAKSAAAGPFNPQRIQSDFIEWLAELAG